jgi:hypothetical protein
MLCVITRGTVTRLRARIGELSVKLVGFLLLLAGWLLVLAAIALLPRPGARAAFVIAGIAVEIIGMVLAARAHLARREESR